MKKCTFVAAIWLAQASSACSSNDPAPTQPLTQAGAATGGLGVTAGAAPGGAGSGGAAQGGQLAGDAAGNATGGASGGLGGVAGQGGSGGLAPTLNGLAQAFEDFRMDLTCDHFQDQPCEPQNSATPNRGYLCCYVDATIERKNHPPVDQELSFQGDAAIVYDVTLRVRGVVENRDYLDQGSKQGDWVRVGGALPKPSAIHVFGITVHDPQQTYFFNSWNDLSDLTRLVALDYEVTVPIRGGAKVRAFEYDDIGKIWSNAGKLTVPGLAPYPEPPEGQFMQFNVVSVKPKP